MKRLVISIVLAAALVIGPASGALADTSQDVTVTATPAYISIANTPGTWTINGEVAGNGVLVPDTLYYANPLGDETAPSATVVNGECRFAVTNTSTVDIDIIVNFPDPVAGDSTNSNLATNDTTKFAAHSYTSYATFNAWPTNKQIAKTTGSTVLLSTTTVGDEFWWGLEYESQSDAWTSGTAMVSTVTITATPS